MGNITFRDVPPQLQATPPQPAYAKVESGTPAQQHMLDWINAYAYQPTPGMGYVVSSNPRYNSLSAGSNSVTWLRGDTNNFAPLASPGDPDGNYTLSFSFETPVGAASSCGRVLFNGMHASEARSPQYFSANQFVSDKQYYSDLFGDYRCQSGPSFGHPNPTGVPCGNNSDYVCQAGATGSHPFTTGSACGTADACQAGPSGAYPFGTETVCGTFPTDCDTSTGLTSEELALEYQLFQVTACALGGLPPPPPPPPPPALATATFTRDFYASCDPGLKLVWQAFNWDASLPDGTAIQYYAASSNDEATLPAAVSAAPATVPIGSATVTTLAPYWGTDAHTVDWHLHNDPPGPPQFSDAWLRVYMVFEPTATSSPTLYDWQQLYDCVPDQ